MANHGEMPEFKAGKKIPLQRQKVDYVRGYARMFPATRWYVRVVGRLLGVVCWPINFIHRVLAIGRMHKYRDALNANQDMSVRERVAANEVLHYGHKFAERDDHD